MVDLTNIGNYWKTSLKIYEEMLRSDSLKKNNLLCFGKYFEIPCSWPGCRGDRDIFNPGYKRIYMKQLNEYSVRLTTSTND